MSFTNRFLPSLSTSPFLTGVSGALIFTPLRETPPCESKRRSSLLLDMIPSFTRKGAASCKMLFSAIIFRTGISCGISFLVNA